MKRNAEFENFEKAMVNILRADPNAVKAAMEAEKHEREEEARQTGKRGRGRPPKHHRASASSRASSEKD
jgi:predicted ArsR family transcriptional regulator